MNYKEVKGDLIKEALQGSFDLITHSTNCQNIQGAGVAKEMAKIFETNNPLHYKLEGSRYKGDINKLGQIDYSRRVLKNGKKLVIVNSYCQYGYGPREDGSPAIDYEALTLCLRKINHIFKGKHIGLPYLIGCGLAGGKEEVVLEIIEKELKDMTVTLVNINK